MAWHRSGDKPLSEPMFLSYWRIYVSLGLSELIKEIWPSSFKKYRLMCLPWIAMKLLAISGVHNLWMLQCSIQKAMKNIAAINCMQQVI